MDVKHVAALANLTLTPAEETKFSSQLNQVVDYISQLQKIDLTDVPPSGQSITLHNVARPDSAPEPCLILDRPYFQVPAIFDND